MLAHLVVGAKDDRLGLGREVGSADGVALADDLLDTYFGAFMGASSIEL